MRLYRHEPTRYTLVFVAGGIAAHFTGLTIADYILLLLYGAMLFVALLFIQSYGEYVREKQKPIEYIEFHEPVPTGKLLETKDTPLFIDGVLID